jgi:hypothetical protein
MPGYFRDPDATAKAMREGGWYASGDLGEMHADGALFVVGRLKEMIIRSGFNVYPAEVETALNTHPASSARPWSAAAKAMATRKSSPSWNCAPVPRSTAALQNHLRERLAPYKRPARIVALPSCQRITTARSSSASCRNRPHRLLSRRLHMQSPRSFAMRRRLLAAGLLGAVAHPLSALAADTWPSKPVRMIVPFPPGGPVDTTARIFGQKLGEMWKVPVVIDNRAGAGGVIGATIAAKERRRLQPVRGLHPSRGQSVADGQAAL